jgi:predicted nuclease of predicted toxin-antitoxin system
MYLANENFPRPSILLLRNNGLIIESIQESSLGISDDEVMITAVKKNLIILTFDSDYGELIYKYAADNPPAVILGRRGQTRYLLEDYFYTHYQLQD